MTTDSPLNIAPSDPEWKAFEKDVANLVARLSSSPSQVRYDEKLPGVRSSVPRQVDIFVEGDLHGIPIAIAIECKKYGRPVDVGEIDAFVGKLADLSVDKGVFYVHDGVTAGARNRARNALHPKVILKELHGMHVADLGWEDLFEFDCPSDNCLTGSIAWDSHKQPAGGADVSVGYCDSCGSPAITCRDCGEVDLIEVGDFACVSCGARYEVEQAHYQSYEIGNVTQTARCID